MQNILDIPIEKLTTTGYQQMIEWMVSHGIDMPVNLNESLSLNENLQKFFGGVKEAYSEAKFQLKQTVGSEKGRAKIQQSLQNTAKQTKQQLLQMRASFEEQLFERALKAESLQQLPLERELDLLNQRRQAGLILNEEDYLASKFKITDALSERRINFKKAQGRRYNFTPRNFPENEAIVREELQIANREGYSGLLKARAQDPAYKARASILNEAIEKEASETRISQAFRQFESGQTTGKGPSNSLIEQRTLPRNPTSTTLRVGPQTLPQTQELTQTERLAEQLRFRYNLPRLQEPPQLYGEAFKTQMESSGRSFSTLRSGLTPKTILSPQEGVGVFDAGEMAELERLAAQRGENALLSRGLQTGQSTSTRAILAQEERLAQGLAQEVEQVAARSELSGFSKFFNYLSHRTTSLGRQLLPGSWTGQVRSARPSGLESAERSFFDRLFGRGAAEEAVVEVRTTTSGTGRAMTRLLGLAVEEGTALEAGGEAVAVGGLAIDAFVVALVAVFALSVAGVYYLIDYLEFGRHSKDVDALVKQDYLYAMTILLREIKKMHDEGIDLDQPTLDRLERLSKETTPEQAEWNVEFMSVYNNRIERITRLMVESANRRRKEAIRTNELGQLKSYLTRIFEFRISQQQSATGATDEEKARAIQFALQSFTRDINAIISTAQEMTDRNKTTPSSTPQQQETLPPYGIDYFRENIVRWTNYTNRPFGVEWFSGNQSMLGRQYKTNSSTVTDYGQFNNHRSDPTKEGMLKNTLSREEALDAAQESVNPRKRKADLMSGDIGRDGAGMGFFQQPWGVHEGFPDVGANNAGTFPPLKYSRLTKTPYDDLYPGGTTIQPDTELLYEMYGDGFATGKQTITKNLLYLLLAVLLLSKLKKS